MGITQHRTWGSSMLFFLQLHSSNTPVNLEQLHAALVPFGEVTLSPFGERFLSGALRASPTS